MKTRHAVWAGCVVVPFLAYLARYEGSGRREDPLLHIVVDTWAHRDSTSKFRLRVVSPVPVAELRIRASCECVTFQVRGADTPEGTSAWISGTVDFDGLPVSVLPGLFISTTQARAPRFVPVVRDS